VSLSWPWCAIIPGVPLTPDELLTTTRSVRKRLDLTRPVPPGLVQECLEIALQAPNGGMREGWHWIVVTDPQVRAQIGDFYRRSAEPYLARAAAADPSRGAGSGVMARVSSSSAYLARHMGQVPVLVIPCITAWFAPASLETAISANCSLVYQIPVPDNRFPHTFSGAYRRYMNGSGPRYTTAPSPSLRASRHRLPASPSSGR